MLSDCDSLRMYPPPQLEFLEMMEVIFLPVDSLRIPGNDGNDSSASVKSIEFLEMMEVILLAVSKNNYESLGKCWRECC